MEIVILRLIHVMGGIFWVGSSLFTSLFLMPSLAKAPHAPQVFAGLQQRGLFTALPIVSGLTLLSGLRLMWLMSSGFQSEYFQTPAGRTFSAAGGLAILAFLIGLIFIRPVGERTVKLGAQLASADEATRARLSAEVAELRKKTQVRGTIATALIVLAAAGMSIARYM